MIKNHRPGIAQNREMQDMEHFAVVEKLCRTALIMSGDAPEVRRQVAHLKSALQRQAAANGGARSDHGGGRQPGTPTTGVPVTGTPMNGATIGRTLQDQAGALEDLLGRGGESRPLPPSGDLPTPQTRARLVQDPVRHMLRKGTLEQEHVDAAEEIRDVFEAVTAGLLASARRLDVHEVIAGSERRAFRQPIERLPERLGTLWRRRYKPWADAVDAVEVGRSANARWSALGLTIAVLVDGRTLNAIDRELRLRRGTAAAQFRGALHRYCVVAGWLRPRLEIIAAASGNGDTGPGAGRGKTPRYQASCGCGARFRHAGASDLITCPHCGERRAVAAALEEGA
jgi:hypothetical protein